MLDELVVHNLGVIADARLEPGPGLVAVTGETGAGKTLLLGALRLLRGDQARSDRIGPHDEEARVEGRFLLPDGVETTLVRRVTSGRSRAYVDGSMTPITALTERLEGLVEIVGQNEHVAIGQRPVARALLDASLDAAGRESRDRYRAAWSRLSDLLRDAESLGGDRRSLERQRDLASFQAEEIDAAGLKVEEVDELDVRLDRLRHAEEIAQSLSAARDWLTDERAAEDAVRSSLAALGKRASADPEIRVLADRLLGIADEIAEIAAAMRRTMEDLDRDPAVLQEAEERKAQIADLQRKYGDSVAEVLAFGEKVRARATELGTLLDRSERIDAEIAECRSLVDAAGEDLREARRRAAKTLGEATTAHLRDLGFRDPVVRFAVEPAPATAHGADAVEIRFASDAALAEGPVSRVASGGELSRLVLAIRLAAGAGDAPIVAFDEVDAGVGGATALAMGEKLAALARDRQVLVVTHLPQVAAFADTHIVVERDGGIATARRLGAEDRRGELARMLGGLETAEGGLLHADELLDEAGRRRG
jgi:DNA repair protein RecN (Recombination protein N)